MLLFDCGVTSWNNLSTSQVNVQFESSDKRPDEPKQKIKTTVVKSLEEKLSKDMANYKMFQHCVACLYRSLYFLSSSAGSDLVGLASYRTNEMLTR